MVGLGVVPRATVAARQCQGARTALDDASGASAILNGTSESRVVVSYKDDRACRSIGVGNNARRTGKGANFYRTTIQIEGACVIEH